MKPRRWRDNMLTVFSIPKPFTGHIGVIQRNAIASWTRLVGNPEVILFGDEEGIEEAARELGVRHVPDINRNEWGTPLLDNVFAQAQALASHDLLCYANADMILLDDLVEALSLVASRRKQFLLTGQRRNVDITTPLSFANGWQRSVRELAERGKLYGPYAMDYFAFRRGMWPAIPPFAVGRACWDNWMVFSAKHRGDPVIDATRAVLAVHQNHSYAHIQHATDGKDWSYSGPEAERNRALAGGWNAVFSLYDANYLLVRGRIIRALTYQHLKRQAFPRIRAFLKKVRRRALPRARFLRLFYFVTRQPERARDLPR